MSLASSVLMDGTTTHLEPAVQFAGVATFWYAVSWSESRTRRISSKFRPQEAGYVIMSSIFLAGLITNTDRTVRGRPGFSRFVWSSMPNRRDTVRVSSAITGYSTLVLEISSTSLSQFRCDSAVSTLTTAILQLRSANLPLICASTPSSVVQTGVKSLGWLHKTAQLPLINSCHWMLPFCVSATKSGQSSPIRKKHCSPAISIDLISYHGSSSSSANLQTPQLK
mmetsp:Transcript_32942/g.92253  ORF Transcript_32942/g.92253 Transcript_32942/m.92253 type:complete len:224 (-) Transcript_32942:94-765(-)